ncbi:MAG: methyltransferase domain-containing protein [Firmicutes bacterium]|nr:methyltransferase domain-containing protein [Bacillota bacterium]
MTVKQASSFTLTDRGLEIAAYKEGSRILDIGCGDGSTVDHLNKKGYKAEGIEMNLAKIAEGKEQFPGIDIKLGDGSFLDDYMSFTFDGIMMEDSLREIGQPDEALHEAYCVMKKGGRLIIRDRYEPNPDPQQVKAVAIEAARRARIPYSEGDCEEGTPDHFVNFRFDGKFFKEPLIRYMEDEVGFRVMTFEDHSEEAGQEDAGCFLLVAQKPL